MSTSHVSKVLDKSIKIPRVYSDTGLFSELYILSRARIRVKGRVSRRMLRELVREKDELVGEC